MTEVFKTLSNAIIVSRPALAALKGPEMETALATIYSNPAVPVRIVDNMGIFFSDQSLLDAINSNSEDLAVIAEFRGIVFGDDEKFVITKMAELRARVAAELLANKPSAIEAWKFAAVPSGWTVDEHIKIKKTTISRKTGDTGYTIGIKTLEKVWNMAAAYWAGSATRDRVDVQAGGYNRTATCYKRGEDGVERVNIGCQTIKRFELEQVALRMGWTFPEVQ